MLENYPSSSPAMWSQKYRCHSLDLHVHVHVNHFYFFEFVISSLHPAANKTPQQLSRQMMYMYNYTSMHDRMYNYTSTNPSTRNLRFKSKPNFKKNRAMTCIRMRSIKLISRTRFARAREQSRGSFLELGCGYKD